jgi:DNA-directed RNA polymerase specialized sigma subunit
MTHFETVLSDIFDRGAEQRLSQDEERETIHAAQSGDEAATVALLYAYAPALRHAVSRYTEALGIEDARSAAVLGFISAVNSFDFDRYDRLAAIVVPEMTHELASAVSDQAPVTVPTRTRTRFFNILRQADGNVAAAALLAPTYEMSRETFYAVKEALGAESYDNRSDDTAGELTGRSAEADMRSLWNESGDAFGDATDRVLVELAFSVVDDQETDICRMSYGFTDYLPVPDGQIAHVLGMARPTVQRKRAGALTKMRAALGA